MKRDCRAPCGTVAAIADLHGTVVYVADSLLRELGYDQPNELVGRSVASLCHMEEQASVMVAAVHRDGIWSGELLASGRNGSRSAVDLSATVVRDGSGTPLCVVLSSDKPRTERKRAETAPPEERCRAQEYLDIAAALILALDTNERVTLINQEGCRILGLQEEEIIGQNWFDSFVPEGMREELRSFFKRLMAGEGDLIDDFESPVLTKSGEERLMSWLTALLRDDQGSIRGTLGSGKDVTGRRRAEKALAETADRYRLLFDESRDAVYISTREGRFLDVNRSLQELLGYSREELMALNALDAYVHRDDRRKFQEQIEKHGYVRDYELKLRKRDGTEIDCLLASTVRKDNSGRVLGYQGIVRDITHRKRAEEALRRSEELYRHIFERSPIGISMASLGGRVITANKAMEEITGYSLEELKGAGLADICVSEKEWDKLAGIIQREGGVSDFAVRLKRADDNTRDALLTISQITLDGEEYYHTICQDITERKLAEEEIKRRNEELVALNAIATAVGESRGLDDMLDATVKKVLEVTQSDAACVGVTVEGREKGWLSVVAHRGLSADAVEQIKDGGLCKGLLEMADRTGQPFVVSSHLEGSDRVQELHALAGIPIEIGKNVRGILGVFAREAGRLSSHEIQILSAISHQIGVAIENVRLGERASEIEILRELNVLRSELIANVSHELRTPLGLIKTMCTTLLRDDVQLDSEAQREFLRDIDEETDKLERMVSNLLDLSAMGSGQFRLHERPIDVAELAREVVDSLDVQLTDHRLILEFPEHPLAAIVDAARIEQVLRNLLSNAIKYSPNGGTITVLGSSDEREVLISVRDQGIGIPEEDLERVFERFYRVDNEVVRQVSGAGLGLSVCRGIVESHAGRIWAESTLGEGSTFSFSIPVASVGQVNRPERKH